MNNAWRVIVPFLLPLLSACEGAGGPPSPDTVAEAAGVELTASEVAEVLAPQAQLPNQPQVVEALANLWVDYFLLARLAAEDTTLANLDVGSLVEQNVNQELVLRLRDQVIQVDTVIPDSVLRELFGQNQPGARVQARHILLRFPQEATPSQVDSVRNLAESLRGRLVAGEDFANLAREYSQDPGSGRNGGDLGVFGRGEMVPPFEEVAFTLPLGEISPVVETTFGLHLIRVDDRIIPDFPENPDQFRAQVQNRRVAEAESTYVARIMEDANVEVPDGSFETARQLAETPDMSLTPRARERTMVSFSGGAYTVGDFQDWLLLRPPSLRSEILGASDEQLDGLLRNLTRERLLLQAAEREGIQVPEARVDSLALAIRSGVKDVARQLGFLAISAGEGRGVEEAANEAVMTLLFQVVQEERDVIPLGGVSAPLRKQFNARIFETGIERAVERITEIRTRGPSRPTQEGGVPVPDTVSPDTAGPRP